MIIKCILGDQKAKDANVRHRNDFMTKKYERGKLTMIRSKS